MNNRKRTKGRKIYFMEFVTPVEAKKDLGFETHRSKLHLVSTDPVTGKKLYAKQGKAKSTGFHVTAEKKQIICFKKTSIKHKIYD